MTGRYPELGAIHLLTPYGHTNIHQPLVYTAWLLRRAILKHRKPIKLA